MPGLLDAVLVGLCLLGAALYLGLRALKKRSSSCCGGGREEASSRRIQISLPKK